MVTPFRNNIPTRVHERIVFNSPLSLPFAPIYSDIDKFVRVIFRRIDGIIRWISGWIVIDSIGGQNYWRIVTCCVQVIIGDNGVYFFKIGMDYVMEDMVIRYNDKIIEII